MSIEKKILVIDDEPDVTELLEYKLSTEGFRVKTCNHPSQAMDEVKDFRPNLIILDVMMPGLDGIQVCRIIRSNQAFEQVPIIFLTAKSEMEDRIVGLEAGGDDYLAKPFNTRELVLRINAIFKRTSGTEKQTTATTLTLGEITIDATRHRTMLRGQSIILTATEFRLLHLLMSQKSHTFSREELLIQVWNYSADIETRTVDTHVRRLREKLEDHGDMIKTVRGIGYKIQELG